MKQLALVFSLQLGILVTATLGLYSTIKPCPSFKSQSNFDINKIMGEWNLAMLFTDEHPEEHEDDSTCIQGNFKKINSTTFKQMWYITSSQHGYGAIIMDLPTIITHSGDWVVTDPLGGQLQVKISHALPDSHLSMTFCGTQHGKSVHLWTAIVTRKTPITQTDFLELSAELLSQGFNTDESKMIVWNKC